MMAGAQSWAVLLLTAASVVLLSSHSVHCRPTTPPPLTFPSFPFFTSSPPFNPYYIPQLPQPVPGSEQETLTSAQVLRLGRLFDNFRSAAADCVQRIQDSLQNASTAQANVNAIVNELHNVWKRQTRRSNSFQVSVQLTELWPAIRDCVKDFISPTGPDEGGQNTALSNADLQQTQRNWESYSSFLDRILNQQPPSPTESTNTATSQNSQQAQTQQSKDWSILCNVMDAAMSESDSAVTQNTQTDTLSQEAHQHTQQAAAQAPSLGDLARRYWPNARECLNDFLDDNENDQDNPGAIASEFERIWKRQTTEVASSQIRQYWPAIRDCVDRFVNEDTSPKEMETDSDVETELFSLFSESNSSRYNS